MLDWPVFCTIRPRSAVIPGTEGVPEHGNSRFLFPRPVPILIVPAFGAVTAALR